MRIWDLEVGGLCRPHLLAEHRELHGLWNVLTMDKAGYRRHPETRRWEGRLAALYARHQAEVVEMTRRGWRHRSSLDVALAAGSATDQPERVNTLAEQRANLRAKGCGCEFPAVSRPSR